MKLIDKDALVAKVDKGINGRNDWQLDEYRKGYHDALTMLKKYLSTLEVKEVKLDKESLTWEDVKLIAEIGEDFMNSEESDNLSEEEYYIEILNRFKAQKGE